MNVNTTLEVFLKLLGSEKMQTKEIADEMNISLRTAQRTIRDIKTAIYQNATLSKYYELKQIGHAYTIEQKSLLGVEQILVIAKVLIASRSLNKSELNAVLDQMMSMLSIDKQSVVKSSIASERSTDFYIGDKSDRLDKIWQLEQFISKGTRIKFDYTDREMTEFPETTTVNVIPDHTFFDNHYLFLVGFEAESQQYRTYRLDWMSEIAVSEERVNSEYDQRPNHGEEAKHNAYGYRGKLTHIKFEYYGYVGYVKDQFPSCRVIRQLNKKNRFPFAVNLLEIDVNYSPGVKLWLLGQTTILRVTEPKEIADDIRDTLYQSYQLYQDEEKK